MNTTSINGSSASLRTAAGCLGFLIILGYFFASFNKTSKRLPLPPGPKPKPVIGNMLDLPPKDTSVSELWTQHRELYGPISSLTVFGTTIIIVNDPDVAHELMDRRSAKYSARPVMQMAGTLSGLDQGIVLTQPGHRFRETRKIYHSLIGSTPAVSKWRKEIDVEVRRFLLRVLDRPEELFEHIAKQAASVVLKFTYGYEVNPHGPDVLIEMAEQCMDTFSQAAKPGEWLVDTIPALRHVPMWFPGAGFLRIAKGWNDGWQRLRLVPYEFATQQIAQGVASTSVISESISKNDTSMTEAEKDILSWAAVSINAGAVDTTLTQMEMFFLAMLHYPDMLRKAQAEIDSVIGNERLPDIEDREKLPYVEAVYKEMYRWEPIFEVGVPHTAAEDDIYEGYHIPKGAMILPHTHGWFHDPKRYRDPDVFKPERFLGPNPEINPIDLVWGHGRRICPGRFFAQWNLWLQVSRTIAVFDIKSLSGRLPAREFSTGAVRKPEPFKAHIKARSQQYEQLIRTVERDAPFPTEGDDKLLRL